MKIGVFDTGVGGEAIVTSLEKTFPEAIIVSVNDRSHLPYGNKTGDQIITFTDSAIQPLLAGSCDVIVLACNTATAYAIEPLRTRYPHQKFVGIEPMVKTAATLSKTKTIAVCATPATLRSSRYNALVQKYASDINIIQPDCSDWAYWIENNQLNQEQITITIDTVCKQGADVIVLGCTHYHWIKDLILDTAKGRAQVVEPSEAIGRRIKQLLDISL